MRDATVTKREQRNIIRAFAAGAGCGFVAGALLVAVLVSPFSTRATGLQRQTSEPATAVMPEARTREHAAENTRSAETPTSTTGHVATVPAPASEPAAGSPAAAPSDLAARDLEIPVEGVKPRELAPSFSDARFGHTHEALDILAPAGTPVKAVEDGTIAKLFVSKAGGITIYQFDPGQQYCYYYAHLQGYADGLREGQTVRKGQIIGYVGTTGNAPRNTPHLHFAIFRLTPEKRWWEGTPIDPYGVLR